MKRGRRWVGLVGLGLGLALGPTGISGGVAGGLGGGAPASATPVSSIEVPVTIIQGQNGITPTVRISLNGSEPLTVLLDSGSSGLVLGAEAVPATLEPSLTSLNTPVSRTYTSASVQGGLYSADMALLGGDGTAVGTWTAPLAIVSCQVAGCGWPRAGIVGVLGIGSGAQIIEGSGGETVLASPFTTAANVTGVAFHFDSSSRSGAFWVGQPYAAGATTFQAPAKQATYSNGLPVFWHYVASCWTISSITACDAYTTFDSGAEYGFIATSQFEPLFGESTGPLPDGTQIAISPTSNAPAVGTMTVSTPNFQLRNDPGKSSEPLASNSGAGFLLDRDVVIDYQLGTVGIGELGVNELGIAASPPPNASGKVVITIWSLAWWGLVGGFVAIVGVVGALGFWLRKTR
ncbi:MAG TPA: hypothetical protein VK139_07180 [Microbacteriaceae bacterium]|nr:hypothetical protein [Microbacteriaceae bacterium]